MLIIDNCHNYNGFPYDHRDHHHSHHHLHHTILTRILTARKLAPRTLPPLVENPQTVLPPIQISSVNIKMLFIEYHIIYIILTSPKSHSYWQIFVKQCLSVKQIRQCYPQWPIQISSANIKSSICYHIDIILI